jgi:hypothetical protein
MAVVMEQNPNITKFLNEEQFRSAKPEGAYVASAQVPIEVFIISQLERSQRPCCRSPPTSASL